MLRCLPLLGLALCGIANAIAQPHIDLAVTPAWSGWTRPGRATEVDIRLTADAAMRATLEVVTGRQTVRADLDLQPGRVLRLHVPVSSAEAIAVSAGSPAGQPERRDVGIAQSESPLLGVALATDDRIHLEGFYAVALGADDLPRNASAYSSIDALILDAPTLGALDQRQLGALLVHAAECGRIVLLSTDPGVRRVLTGAGGCGGHALMRATSLTDAKELLKSSLAANRVRGASLPEIGEFARPDRATWNRVLVVLAAYFASAALAVIFFSSLPMLLLMPALATLAILALLHTIQPPPQVVVWSEGESGAQIARYHAWQQFPGTVRGHANVPALSQLGSARPCEPNQPMRLGFDASRGRATFSEFDTRLFRQISLCYSGSFPLVRTIGVEARPDGLLEVRNAGTMSWPSGVLLAGNRFHELPALGPGDNTIIRSHAGIVRKDALARTAMARTQADGVAALWELQPGSVAGIPVESNGWLLVSIPPP